MDANMTKFISWCCIIKVLISTITMDVITKLYHTVVCTYKATPHQHHSEVTVFKINKRHSFLLTLLHFSFTRRTITSIYHQVQLWWQKPWSYSSALLQEYFLANEQCFLTQQISISINISQISVMSIGLSPHSVMDISWSVEARRRRN